MLWALGLYLANAMKNMLLLPRPRCLDGRVRNLLERMYEMRFLKSSLNKLDGRSLFSSKSTTQRSLNNQVILTLEFFLAKRTSEKCFKKR